MICKMFPKISIVFCLVCLFFFFIFYQRFLHEQYEIENYEAMLHEKKVNLLKQENRDVDSEYLRVLQEYQKKEQLLLSLKEEITISQNQLDGIIEERIQMLPHIKEVYLTFDDGPSSLTEDILDLLKKYQAKATFFVVDWDIKYDSIIQRIVKEGHSIGLHGYSHDYKQMYTSVDSFFENIEPLREKIKNLTGVDTRIIRFPGGSSNTISRFSPSIMTKLTKEVLLRGYRYFDWNISSGDAMNVGVSQFIKNSTNVHNKESVMILMHDSKTKKVTVKGLEEVLKFYQKEGYTFQKVTMKSPMFSHKVKN